MQVVKRERHYRRIPTTPPARRAEAGRRPPGAPTPHRERPVVSRPASPRRVGLRRAFSLIELLVVLGVVMLLIGLLIPALRSARETARIASCLSNQHQLIIAWSLYANDYQDRAMPLAYWSEADIGGGPQVFWWGTHGTPSSPVDLSRGFIGPYLGAELARKSVFECVSQPWGSYRPQGASNEPTSTYGYNGYYLSPAKTPGWGATIGFRPWRRLSDIVRTPDLFVFADTLLPMQPARNCALLDPPQIYSPGEGWTDNTTPTTAFRHHTRKAGQGTAVTSRADGSAQQVVSRPEWIVVPGFNVGSAGQTNAAHYVPDADEWR